MSDEKMGYIELHNTDGVKGVIFSTSKDKGGRLIYGSIVGLSYAYKTYPISKDDLKEMRRMIDNVLSDD